MPVALPRPIAHPLFPPLTRAQVDAARMSAWYPIFRQITIPSTIIDLDSLGESEAFLEWIDSDSIFLPEGSQGVTFSPGRPPSPAASEASSSSSSSVPVYQLPNLNAAIRAVIAKYGGAVFPKVNWTSPKDASFILPQTSYGPLHCTAPADVYLLLKSSDFISHDLDPTSAYEGCGEAEVRQVRVELVLRRFIEMHPAREMRCFVRENVLLGVVQRDTNYYEHFQSEETQTAICDTVRAFWEDELFDTFGGGKDYIFDIHLSSDLESATLIDINPYRSTTDPLLFTYSELLTILETSQSPSTNRPRLPIMRVIDSRTHPIANRNVPAYGGNMMPIEVLEMSHGRSMADFRGAWDEALAAGMTE